ncbi:hypothetical protein [Pseudomonas sp. NFACC37-1]|uniref:hypothetical protein n=1 Tax=Pseudomonas sp. NFACC37-1 TaxID=1566196 RepID=UPI00088F46D4|nr:hypothetical protein [Pseudomonas sp. NFACC37-1]SCY83073.1 hypothetical protein SAMN03159391_03299 [Pseudomonas sp. NFACC37-1]
MTKLYRTRQGEENRDAYTRARREPKLVGEMTAPGVLDALPGDPDGLLLRRTLDAPIRIEIPIFDLGDNPAFPSSVYFQWRRENNEEYETISDPVELRPDGSVTFPVPQQIEMEHFDDQEGQFLLRYRATLWAGNEDYSLDTRVRLDRTGPYLHLQDPHDIPPVAVLTSNPITDATLDAENGVEIEIPDFQDPDRDRISVAVGWTKEVPDPSEPIVPDILLPLPPSRKVTVPRDKVESLRSGTHYVTYVLIDPAQNVSKPSRVRDVPVALGGLPTNLHPHSVPLADDGLINRADASYGVTVDFRRYDNPQPEDQIVVEWGGTTLQPFPVGEVPPDTFRIPVSWNRLKQEYDFIAQGVQTVTVGYRVERAPQVVFRPTPATIDVDVDFSITGPVEPGDPDPNPVNPLLDKVKIISSTDAEDELTEADFNRPARARFRAPYPIVAGDTFILYWKGVAVAHKYVADGSERPGAEIIINITWGEIEDGGTNTKLPVYYAMTHPDSPNNEHESVTTDVWVHAVPIVLSEPAFTDIGNSPVLNCSHLRSVGGVVGYRIKVSPSPFLVTGEDITLRWRPFEADGTTPISVADKTSTIPIPEGAATAGLDWFVEYDAHVLPTDPGSGTRHAQIEVDYTIPINGSPEPSIKLRKTMSIALGSDGATCDLDIVVPAP